MRSLSLIVAGGLAAAALQPAAAVSPGVARPGVEALLDAVMPADLWRQDQLDNFDDWFDESIADDAPLLALFKQEPALRARIKDALDLEIGRLVKQDIPRLRAQFGQMFVEGMTPAQIQALTAFVGSPTGQQIMMLAVNSRSDDDDFTETPEFQKLAAKMVVDKQDLDRITALSKSGAAERLQALGSKMSGIRDKWESHFRISNRARLKSLVVRTAATYMDEKNAKAQLW